jgi:hypothetical protein
VNTALSEQWQWHTEHRGNALACVWECLPKLEPDQTRTRSTRFKRKVRLNHFTKWPRAVRLNHFTKWPRAATW